MRADSKRKMAACPRRRITLALRYVESDAEGLVCSGYVRVHVSDRCDGLVVKWDAERAKGRWAGGNIVVAKVL